MAFLDTMEISFLQEILCSYYNEC